MNNQRIVVSVNLKRTIKIMKLTVLMLVVCLSQMVAATYAQTTKLSVSVKNETLEHVLKQIEEQSEFLFFYNLEEINKNERISIDKRNTNISEILDAIAEKTGLKYAIRDRHIVLMVNNESPAVAQQSHRVTGVVKDAAGIPVIGANVVVKGTTNGTVTNIDGEYSLSVPSSAVLQISYIGYNTQEVTVGNKTVLNILLQEDSQRLNEVIVVGYGTQKKATLTGAVASVRSEQIANRAASDATNLLTGIAPGLTAIQRSGQPGADGAEFIIRGPGTLNSTSPLIIVDGIPGSLNAIDPNDIENISVLKDAASAAIYGVRAGNGVILVTTKKGKEGRMNLEQVISKYVKVGVNLTLSRNQMNNVPLGSGQNENASIMVAAAQFNPILGIRDENGEYILNDEAAFLPNPVSLLDITDKTTKERLLATSFIEVKPIKDLTLKANLGIDRNYQKHKVYLPKTTLYGAKKDGQADIAQYDKSDYLLELTANYAKQFGNHNLNALVGYSFQRFTDESLSAGNSQFLIDGFLYNNLGAGAYPKPSVGSSASKDEMASFFGRVNYSFKDRYLLTATLRADGASNFAQNNRWGYFPSVALGWRFTEEEFMRPLTNVLSNGKLRLSYGQTGNSNIGNKAISYYKTGNNNEFGGTESVGVYLDQMGNPDLKWETTTEWNVGLDLGFFNNRLNVTAEYYHKVVSDLLSERTLLSYNEVSKIAANIGETQSQGFELTINTKNIDTKDFSWNSDFTFSFYRDKWKTRDASWKPAAYSQYDAPIRYYFGYMSDGLIQEGETVDWMAGSVPGQVKIKDLDGYVYNEDGTLKVDKYGIPVKSGKPDGKIDEADMVIYGSKDPGYMIGFNNTLRYKNFDFNIYFYGQFALWNIGSYKDLWLTGADGMTGIVNMYRGYNMPVSSKDVWSHDNTSATRPGYFQDKSPVSAGSTSTGKIGDYYLEKSWFIRCRNITLGYTIPMKQSKKVLSNIRVYADINNPFTITPYKGLDLETDNSVWAYPNVRSFSLGLDITF